MTITTGSLKASDLTKTDETFNGNMHAASTSLRIAIDSGNGLGDLARSWRNVGVITEPSLFAWDGVDESFALALSSRVDGVFSPARITVTGRRERLFSGNVWGWKAKVELWNDGDVQKADAILVP